MSRRDRVPETEPRQGTQPGKAKPGVQIKPPRQLEKPRKGAAGIPRRGDGAQPPEPSEDFGERRDIQTADEPAEQHDRRHHDRGRSDVESSQPV